MKNSHNETRDKPYVFTLYSTGQSQALVRYLSFIIFNQADMDHLMRY